jgi:Flp pilus assembly protein TadG
MNHNPSGHRWPTPQRRGALMALMPAVIVLLCMVVGFSFDMGYLYLVKSDLQSASDSAALAAAFKMSEKNAPEVGQVANQAILYAELNEPNYGKVLVAGDIEMGSWDFGSKSFTPGNVQANAVRTIVRRDGTNTAKVQMFFMSVFGVDEVAVTATSVAAFTVDADGKQSSFAKLVQ